MRRLAAAALGALAAANPPGPDIFKRQRIHDCGAATFRAVAEPRGAFKMRFLCAQRRSRACSWTSQREFRGSPDQRGDRAGDVARRGSVDGLGRAVRRVARDCEGPQHRRARSRQGRGQRVRVGPPASKTSRRDEVRLDRCLNESRRRRGRDVDIPWRRVAATPRPRRDFSVTTGALPQVRGGQDVREPAQPRR